MQWSDIQRNPDRRTLRQFSAIWLLFFGVLAVVQQAVREAPLAAVICAALAMSVGPIGLVWPLAVRHVFVGWSMLAFPIGWAVSWIALGTMFFGVFTPIGLAFRLAGRDPLARRRPLRRDTYWVPRKGEPDAASYLRQA
jgi:hypothetical protein